jgi:hypothetical protein
MVTHAKAKVNRETFARGARPRETSSNAGGTVVINSVAEDKNNVKYILMRKSLELERADQVRLCINFIVSKK